MEGLEDMPLDGGDEDADISYSSEDESNSSVSSDEDEDAIIGRLSVTEDTVAQNYRLLGNSSPADPPLHCLQQGSPLHCPGSLPQS